MPPARTQMYLLPFEKAVTRAFRSGVSLHSHTEHSRERLGELPRHLERMPVVAQFMKWEIDRYRARTGETPDFSRAHWRGPVTAQAALELESRQISDLGLAPMVSLTDHDNIDAGLLLRSQAPESGIPISVEWSMPYGESYFHMGIHNLALTRAIPFLQCMLEYTREPKPEVLGPFLEELTADPGVLIVLNHPLWDMGGIGPEAILNMARAFLRMYGGQIHALEINGLRTWNENLDVAKLAREFDFPLVGGGDRHGFEPNATINLTRAATFAEFVREIRVERSSDIAVLPQYREPLVLRHFLTAWDAVRHHPQLGQRAFWIDRVYVACDDGVERPLSQVWTKGAPQWIDPCLNVIGFLACRTFRSTFQMAVTMPVPTARSAIL